MNNPYEWLIETYASNIPPREPEVYEKWRRNLNTVLLQSIAWEQGYEAGGGDATDGLPYIDADGNQIPDD